MLICLMWSHMLLFLNFIFLPFWLGEFHPFTFQITYMSFCVISSAIYCFYSAFYLRYLILFFSQFFIFSISLWKQSVLRLILFPNSVSIFIINVLNTLSGRLLISLSSLRGGAEKWMVGTWRIWTTFRSPWLSPRCYPGPFGSLC